MSILDDITATFTERLRFPDARPLHAVLGAVAGTYFKGHKPVWLLVVGASSSGKTLMIDPLRSLSKVQPISDFTGPALLSGMKTRNNAKQIGVLNDLGHFGFLTFKDFTSQLSANDGSVGDNIKVLRELYDGHYERPVGTFPEPLHWFGKLGIVGATTSAIDAHHQVIAEMGERFLFYRMPPTAQDERLAKTEAALVADVEDPDADDALSAAVATLQPTLDALFDRVPPVIPTAIERTHLTRLADLVARCRSSVPRRGTTMELTHLPDTEEGPRAGVELQRLWMGLRALGAGGQDAMDLVTKVASDSIPNLRRQAIEVLDSRGPNEAITPREAVEGTGVDPRTMLRPLADLAYHQVFEATYIETMTGTEARFRLAPKWRGVWRELFSAGVEELPQARPPAAEPSNVFPFVARQVTPSMAPQPCGSCATPTRWTDDAGAPQCSACRPTADVEEDF